MNKKGMTLIEVMASVVVISIVVIVYVQFSNMKNQSREELNTMLELEYKMALIIEEEYQKIKNNVEYGNANIDEKREIEINGKGYEVTYKTKKLDKEFQWKTDKIPMIKMELKTKIGKEELGVEAYVTKK